MSNAGSGGERDGNLMPDLEPIGFVFFITSRWVNQSDAKRISYGFSRLSLQWSHMRESQPTMTGDGGLVGVISKNIFSLRWSNYWLLEITNICVLIHVSKKTTITSCRRIWKSWTLWSQCLISAQLCCIVKKLLSVSLLIKKNDFRCHVVPWAIDSAVCTWRASDERICAWEWWELLSHRQLCCLLKDKWMFVLARESAQSARERGTKTKDSPLKCI